MTATANPLAGLTIDQLNDAIQKLTQREKTERQSGEKAKADSFLKSLNIYKAELDSRATKPTIEKKNEPAKALETPKATAGATATTKPFELVGAIEPDNNIVVFDSPDTEGVDIDDKYRFTSLEDFNEFKGYKDRLRDLLRNWLRKKDKQAFDYEEMNVRVNLIVSKIMNFIDFKARQEFKSVLKNQTYQIGDKKLMQEVEKEDVRFGFDVSQLKKDFNF